MNTATAAALANGVLLLHASIAVFVVFGLVFIVLGWFALWPSARNRTFRMAHLVAIAVVVAESWFGIVCPLTTLERWLRLKAGTLAYPGGFIEHWVGQALFYTAPPWVFGLAYSVFGSLVVLSWWLFPPKAFGSSREAVA